MTIATNRLAIAGTKYVSATYALNLSSRLGIDLSSAVLEKIRENERKYPVKIKLRVTTKNTAK